MPGFENGEPLSIRRSIIVWLAGGVVGWVVAVVLIYGTIRATSNDNFVENAPEEAERSIAVDEQTLQDISPAAGPSPAEEATPEDPVSEAE